MLDTISLCSPCCVAHRNGTAASPVIADWLWDNAQAGCTRIIATDPQVSGCDACKRWTDTYLFTATRQR